MQSCAQGFVEESMKARQYVLKHVALNLNPSRKCVPSASHERIRRKLKDAYETIYGEEMVSVLKCLA